MLSYRKGTTFLIEKVFSTILRKLCRGLLLGVLQALYYPLN